LCFSSEVIALFSLERKQNKTQKSELKPKIRVKYLIFLKGKVYSIAFFPVRIFIVFYLWATLSFPSHPDEVFDFLRAIKPRQGRGGHCSFFIATVASWM
jgi:hypothetical protein